MSAGVAPDVRDGLTPVCRRALCELALVRARTAQYVKSAGTVDSVLSRGRVEGGRRAIYGELVRMARDWEVRHPLVDGRGNLGSIDGDGAVSADYSEMRLGMLGDELLRDVGEDVVQVPCGAVTGAAPRVLPARFPNCSSTAPSASRQARRRAFRRTTCARSSTPSSPTSTIRTSPRRG
jgi:DNA gyrase subunit A